MKGHGLKIKYNLKPALLIVVIKIDVRADNKGCVACSITTSESIERNLFLETGYKSFGIQIKTHRCKPAVLWRALKERTKDEKMKVKTRDEKGSLMYNSSGHRASGKGEVELREKERERESCIILQKKNPTRRAAAFLT